MILVIDASNCRVGGGLTYLKEILNEFNGGKSDFKHLIVWCRKEVKPLLPENEKIIYRQNFLIDGNFVMREIWQRLFLARECRKDKCNLLFVPGGAYLGKFRPFVTMHQNSLPFNAKERARFGRSWTAIRYHLLSRKQTITFNRSASTIYLTQFAKQLVFKKTGNNRAQDIVIPHGVSTKFQKPPRKQCPPERYSFNNPFKFLYVSIINFYKHQWNVVEAIANLREKGYPVTLDLVGPSNQRALKLLNKSLAKFCADNTTIRYHGKICYEEVQQAYHDCDAFVWASSCEAFGMILLEAMSSGLPIACSSASCSPEILKNAGWYFDPENVPDLEKTLIELFESVEERQIRSKQANDISHRYSWESCATKTFSHLQSIAFSMR